MHKTTFVMHENRSEDVHKQPHSGPAPDVIYRICIHKLTKMNLQDVHKQLHSGPDDIYRICIHKDESPILLKTSFFSDVTALYVTSRIGHRLNLASPRGDQLSCILQAKNKIHHIEYNFKIYAS
jgi:hypothetical protein